MSTIATKDGTQIYHNDRGSSQPIIFGHGWPVPLTHQGLSENQLGGRFEEDRRATLVIHGDDAQIVPTEAPALLSSKLIKNAVLCV